MTKTAVSYWELGKVAIPHAICLALESLYGVSADWLVDGTEPMWRPKAKALSATRSGLFLCPVLQGDAPFDGSGLPLPPPPDGEVIGIPAGLVSQSPLSKEASKSRHCYWIQITDSLMQETLGSNSLVLVDGTAEMRQVITDHALYLVQIEGSTTPCVRRLAADPSSGDLIAATEARHQVPMRLPQAGGDQHSAVLGRVLWILKSAAS